MSKDKELIAKCGKTGFKSIQGLRGHERMCPKCLGIAMDEKPEPRKQERQVGGCLHKWRLLYAEEKNMCNSQGLRAGDLYVAVCEKCGELK